MKRMKGKFLSILMVFVMLIGMVPAMATTAHAAEKTQVSNITATTNAAEIIGYGKTNADPSVTVLEGQKYVVLDTSWQKKNGSSWDFFNDPVFSAGTYRVRIVFAINGDNFKTHEFADSVSANIDGKDWAVDSFTTAEYYESLTVYSGEFNVEKIGSGPTLESISITTPPTKTSYQRYENFDPTGMVVIAKYSDGTTKELSPSDYEIPDGMHLDIRQYRVHIRYTDGAETAETTQKITMVEDRTRIPKIVATSNLVGPVTGAEMKKDFTFTMTEGSPAKIAGTGDWQYRTGDSWLNASYSNEFENHPYRYVILVSVGGDANNDWFVDENTTAIIDGKEWTAIKRTYVGGYPAGDDVYNDMSLISFASPEMTAPATQYSITVNGEGNPKAFFGGAEITSQERGKAVSLGADATCGEKVFDKWVSEDVEITNADQYNGAYFTMPAKNVTVTATYKNASESQYSITVKGEGNPKAFFSGAEITSQAPGKAVALSADATYGEQVFDKWVSEDVEITNADKYDGAYFTMPSKNVTVTATYKNVSAKIESANAQVTVPVAGENPNFTATPSDSDKYTTVVGVWYDHTSGKTMTEGDTFIAGHKYDLRVVFTAKAGYTFDNNTVFTINENSTNSYSTAYGYREISFEVPEEGGDSTPTVSIPETLALKVGESSTLTATGDYEGHTLSWSSDKEEVATVDENGKVTAVAAGTATITVTLMPGAVPTAEDEVGYPTASCLVTVTEKETEAETYTVTVENGSGDGEYEAGEPVTIKADSKSGYKFDKWIVESDVEVEIDVNDSETTFTMPAGNVKVTADYDKISSGSSSSGGSTKYKVTLEDTDNGSVESSRTKASKGTTVTITVDPEEGYEVDDIVVETKAGKEVEVTDKGEGKFTFKMPAANVTVSVDFAKADVEDSDAKDEVEYIQLTIDSVIAWVFDEFVANDVAPVIRNARTMLPARFVAEALGGVVTWDETEQKVTIVNGEDTIVIFIGEPFATVNGDPVELDSPAFIENDRTYLPIRFIAENMGATVTWDADARTVTIVPGE